MPFLCIAMVIIPALPQMFREVKPQCLRTLVESRVVRKQYFALWKRSCLPNDGELLFHHQDLIQQNVGSGHEHTGTELWWTPNILKLNPRIWENLIERSCQCIWNHRRLSKVKVKNKAVKDQGAPCSEERLHNKAMIVKVTDFYRLSSKTCKWSMPVI